MPTDLFSIVVAVGILCLSLFVLCLKRSFFVSRKKKNGSTLPSVPAVPGSLPLLGNLLQLKEKKPHKTFAKWAEIYGPIYSIKTGSSNLIVVNSNDIAKEAMVTRFSSISTRKLSNALKVLTYDKCMVATSDYDDFHKMVKRCLMTNLLGPTAQRRMRQARDTMIDNMISELYSHVKRQPHEAVNFKKIFESALFGLAMKQAIGKDVESVYVQEFGTTMSRREIFKILVLDMMEGAIEVDWRDFFPYLRWVPNKTFDKTIQEKHFRRVAVIKALMEDYNQRTASGEEPNCYLYDLLSEAKTLTTDQIAILLWEIIIETADTVLVTTEWAMYELAKDSDRQNRLFEETKRVCGVENVKEEDISQLRYLGGVFHETLRKHSPVPIIPLRYAHEDTQLGGYYIPAGSEIAINIYGCNMDKKQWETPEKWTPERFLDDKYNPSDLQKTMAFGGGKRVCAGSLEASLVASVAIGRLVQEFQWSLADGEEENVDTVGLTSQKLRPLVAHLKPRGSN